MRSSCLAMVSMTHIIGPLLTHVCYESQGTYNSKNGERVKIIQQWDRYRPPIQDILTDFRVTLIEEELSRINAAKKIFGKKAGTHDKINWIEKLLHTPITDHRRYCLWRILAPYFANVRRLSDDESISAVKSWLVECSKLRPLKEGPVIVLDTI